MDRQIDIEIDRKERKIQIYSRWIGKQRAKNLQI